MKEIDSFYMSDKQIEKMKREKIWNKKMAKTSKWFLTCVASILVFGIVPDVLTKIGVSLDITNSVAGLSLAISSLSGIIGCCKFAKALHEPLTEKETEELAEKDAIEKGGFSK